MSNCQTLATSVKAEQSTILHLNESSPSKLHALPLCKKDTSQFLKGNNGPFKEETQADEVFPLMPNSAIRELPQLDPSVDRLLKIYCTEEKDF